MVGCMYKGKVEYITKFSDFRDMMDDSVFDALEIFVENMLFSEREEGKEEGQNLAEVDKDFEVSDLMDDLEEAETNSLKFENAYNSLLIDIENAVNSCIDEVSLKEELEDILDRNYIN